MSDEELPMRPPSVVIAPAGFYELAREIADIGATLRAFIGVSRDYRSDMQAGADRLSNRVDQLGRDLDGKINALHDDLTPVLNDYLVRKKKEKDRLDAWRRRRVRSIRWLTAVMGAAATGAIIKWSDHIINWFNPSSFPP